MLMIIQLHAFGTHAKELHYTKSHNTMKYIHDKICNVIK